VSFVQRSHSPFGPCSPGAQAADETRICAPFAFKLLAMPGEKASAQMSIPTFPSGSIGKTVVSVPGVDQASDPTRSALILRCDPARRPSGAMAKTVL